MTQDKHVQPPLVLAVDIGGTNTRVALVDTQGTVIARERLLTLPQQGMTSGLERITAAMRRLAATAPAGALAAVGIGSPGLVDPWRGVVRSPANLPGWDGAPLQAVATQALGLPVAIGNDANLGALGEQRFGAGRGVADLVYLTISTGIGGGIISGGRLLLGAAGLAGEVGHVTIEANGPQCACGNYGCLEVLASGTAIGRMARDAMAAGAESAMRDLAGGAIDAIDAEVVATALQQGDALAISVIQRAGFFIGVGIVNFIHLLNPRLIILGGGVSNVGEPLLDAIRRTVDERAVAVMRQDVKIVLAVLGDDAGLLGAAALAFDLPPR